MEKQIKSRWTGLVVAAFILFAGCQEPPALKVGVGETVITPDPALSQPMRGYDRGGASAEGTHDDLHARALVVEGSDGQTMAMMTLSLVNLEEEKMDRIRRGIEEQTGIPFENIAISTTHTHSGPRVGDPDSDYGQFLISQSIESAVQAWESRVPGRIGTGSAEVLFLAMNDRRMGHGGITPDPEAAVIKVEDAAGDLMGLFFNYGAHPSTLSLHNRLWSEDWPYFTIRDLKSELGEDLVVGYFQAASGDTKVGYEAELSAIGAFMYGIRSYEFAEKKSRLLTDAILDLVPGIETSGDLQVRAVYDRFDFPLRDSYPWTHEEALEWQRDAQARVNELEERVAATPTTMEEHLEWQRRAREMVADGEFDTSQLIGPRLLDRARVDLWLATQAVGRARTIEAGEVGIAFGSGEIVRVEAGSEKGTRERADMQVISMPMQAFRLGETIFVTFPNEVFSEIGLEVKRFSPFDKTFILGVAGGYRGYIPTAAEFIERGYAANGSPFSPAAEQVIIDASLELIDRVSE